MLAGMRSNAIRRTGGQDDPQAEGVLPGGEYRYDSILRNGANRWGQSKEEFHETPQLPRYAKRTACGKLSVAPVLTSPRKRDAPGLRGWTAVLVWPAEKEESRDPMTAAATLAMCAHSEDAITRRPGWSR
jgi:hypothetical protein